MPKTRSSTSKRRGISRIDQPSTRTHGWFVRVGYHERRDGSYGPRHTKFFGDISHGGKRKALLAAETFVKGVTKAPKKARKPAAKKGRKTARRAA